MHPQKKFHLVFSFVMGAMMISLMTLVITFVNLGLSSHFFQAWMKAFGIAYVVGVPVIFFWPRWPVNSPGASWVFIRPEHIRKWSHRASYPVCGVEAFFKSSWRFVCKP